MWHWTNFSLCIMDEMHAVAAMCMCMVLTSSHKNDFRRNIMNKCVLWEQPWVGFLFCVLLLHLNSLCSRLPRLLSSQLLTALLFYFWWIRMFHIIRPDVVARNLLKIFDFHVAFLFISSFFVFFITFSMLVHRFLEILKSHFLKQLQTWLFMSQKIDTNMDRSKYRCIESFKL